MIEALLNKLPSRSIMVEETDPEPEPEEDDGEDSEDSIPDFVRVPVEKTETLEKEVTKETLDIIWNDGSDTTTRSADRWEKEDGEYVLYNVKDLYYGPEGHRFARAQLRCQYEVNIKISEDSVKAIDVMGRQTRTLEYERTFMARNLVDPRTLGTEELKEAEPA